MNSTRLFFKHKKRIYKCTTLPILKTITTFTNVNRKEKFNMNKEITNVSIDVLKVHPRNTEFFDDISGAEYEEFKNSIKEEGIISEIIVAPDMIIVSGHQRYKAAKELGIKMIPIRIREDLIDEDKKLKVLLAANFGRSKNDDAKQRKVAVEYVRLCGYKNGENQWGCQVGTPKLSIEEFATTGEDNYIHGEYHCGQSSQIIKDWRF